MHSIGTKRWDGTPIYIGYENRIGNRQFEVDHEISKAEMPSITGSSIESDDDIEIISSQVDSTPFVEAKRSKSSVIDVDAIPESKPKLTAPPTPPPPAPVKKYVAPASFYAPAPKIKAKGPL